MGATSKPVSELVLPDAMAAEVDRLAGQPAPELKSAWQREFRRSSKKPFRAPKGVVSEPSLALDSINRAKETVLCAIGKAQRWADRLMAGDDLATIASEDGQGVPDSALAFIAPKLPAWQQCLVTLKQACAVRVSDPKYVGGQWTGACEICRL